jgi:DME family drug/metabolite transporter
LATAAAYALFTHGLPAVPVAGAATLSLAEPLTAGLLGVLMLGEQVGLAALLGVSLVVGGLALDSVGRKTPPDGRLE